MGSYLLDMSMVLQLFTAERKLVYIESKDVFRDWNDVPMSVWAGTGRGIIGPLIQR